MLIQRDGRNRCKYILRDLRTPPTSETKEMGFPINLSLPPSMAIYSLAATTLGECFHCLPSLIQPSLHNYHKTPNILRMKPRKVTCKLIYKNLEND